MATIRVSGTVSTNPTPGASYTISAPDGSITITSSNTNIISSSPTGTLTIQTPSSNYTSKTQAVSSTTGALVVAGGVGIGGDLWVGGKIYGVIDNASTSLQLVITSTNVDSTFYLTFTDTMDGTAKPLRGDNVGEQGTGNENGLTYNPFSGTLRSDKMFVASTATSTDPTNGAFTVTGGAGVLGPVNLGNNLTVAGNILPATDGISDIGSSSTQWAEAYLNKIYSPYITTTGSNLTLEPQGGLTDIIGDIRVQGTKPIGTAPVVTNVLYVTMDGSDTNDGRALDPSRACRTITGAVNSPYYQPGTQIQVSPGFYLEDNPIRLKPYTSIMGSDIRTTSVEPINKTQDLFHLDSGCYLAFMQFLNGRSGLLEGPYEDQYNRGAYATAFPPLPVGERIDLFHSPYVQNCTNLSGPWLRDGTLFTPNQTVQVPDGVGMGTWPANTTSLVVSITTGTITQGMHVDVGQQNPGFFNARTLMLANKPFLQEQVVSRINSLYPSFVYNQEKCKRDVGILVENIAYDAAFGGNEKAVQSGLSYYDGVISLIAGQETQTVVAIEYLRDRCLEIITNTTCTFTVASLNSQVRNTVLTGGEVASDSLENLFEIVTTIINNGPDAAPAVYNSTGPDAAFVSAEILMQANRAFMQEDTLNYINNNLCWPPKPLPYNKIKCKRDTGLIIDSVAFDLVYSTSTFSQSTFAGIQYWNQDGYVTAVEDQITTATAAVTYLRDLAIKIIQNITTADDLIDRYQNGFPNQNTSLESATSAEAAIIANEFNIILDILGGNSLGWSDKIIPNGYESNFISVQNAIELLQTNKEYMKNEVVAYVDQAYPTFLASYTTATLEQAVVSMIDSVSFDLLYGGNRQAVQSGLAFYAANVSSITIESEEVQTTDAFTHLASIANDVIQNIPIAPSQTKIKQVFFENSATTAESSLISQAISTITNIISDGPVGYQYTTIGLTPSTNANVLTAFDILLANKSFLQAEVVSYLDNKYNPDSFKYDEEKCFRDTGLIIDAVSQDILLGGNKKSIEAGVSYWAQGYNYVAGQETTTTMAINYIKDIALKIIANQPVTAQTGTFATQIINPFFQYGGDYMPQQAVARNFHTITDIIQRGVEYAPPEYQGGGLYALTGINGLDVKLSPQVTSVQPFSYNETQWRSDSDYIIDSVYHDVALGTNYNAVTAGNAYRLGTIGSPEVLYKELRQTKSSINFLKSTTSVIIAVDSTAVARANASYDEINSIVSSNPPSTITFSNPTGGNAAQVAAKDQLFANNSFIQAETIAWIHQQIADNSGIWAEFTYDQENFARDVGYIVDALCYDILYGGNTAVRKRAQAFFAKNGTLLIPGKAQQYVAAFQHMKTVSQTIILGNTVTITQGVQGNQVDGGDNATATEVTTLGDLVNIIIDVITAGSLSGLPASSNPSIAWVDTNIQTAVTLLSNDKPLLINNTINYVDSQFADTYTIGLNQSTIGFGTNATLYFGDTLVFPRQDDDVPDEWAQRRVDPIGGMGGSLVDGGVISARSPINSFVYDAYTQLTQGGRGVRITNNGYAQLVSVFTIFSSTGVQVDNGGIASIVNSNANFGDICLLAKGFGKRKFTGTLYNPAFKAYPDSPGEDGFNQYYPNGFWPNNARIQAFLPDLNDRPHISLVMEVLPPREYVNEQAFPGFLNAVPSLSGLNTGTITITGVNTDGIAIGNTLYIRDQFGSQTGTNGLLYSDTDTVVTDLGYQSVTLSKALTSGGGEVGNDNFFNLYFCGNAYYTVLSSEIADNPKLEGVNLLSSAATGGSDQIAEHVDALRRLNTVVDQVISNISITPSAGVTEPQIVDNLVTGGAAAQTFIDLRFGEIISIVTATNVTAAEAIIPEKLRTKTGPTVQGAGSAIILIERNINFIIDEIDRYVKQQNPSLQYDENKCKRDVKIILQRLIYDIETGGRYNSVMTGLSYWSRYGTHHIVQIGENVRRTDLFPDGAEINFYQRSYMSASGYVFEYVGAGTNYGALPQFGIADPVQGKETVQLNSGKVFFTSTDQNGDFRIGPGLVISQATGVLSGRTFTKSLFANMTPFILAIEGGGI
jgi:hypothetical protein